MQQGPTHPERLFPYLLIGIYLGFVFTKSEVISWFRIQEMFRFQSFHMYGVIGGALGVAVPSVWLLKKKNVLSATGSALRIPSGPSPSSMKPYLIGGTIFGLGWALLGACPGPLYALLGTGATVLVVALGAALLGAWTYGLMRPKLPH